MYKKKGSDQNLEFVFHLYDVYVFNIIVHPINIYFG